ncbi:MAG: hypothetical protein Q8R06_06105 [Polaromonas sp.]|nr:hypothetical protein [Polaromonas sp.]MDP3796711.1 hypothetical protein [Polaromonas sp.]
MAAGGAFGATETLTAVSSLATALVVALTAGLVIDLVTGLDDLAGLAATLVLAGVWTTAFLLATGADFFVGSTLAVFLAAGGGAGLALPAGLTVFFAALTAVVAAALGADLAFTAALATVLAGVLDFLAVAFTICLLSEAALGESPGCLLVKLLSGSSALPCAERPVARSPGLSAALPVSTGATLTLLAPCFLPDRPPDSAFRVFWSARDCSGSPACCDTLKPNRWRIETNMKPSCLL